jgi:hypothetical protein
MEEREASGHDARQRLSPEEEGTPDSFLLNSQRPSKIENICAWMRSSDSSVQGFKSVIIETNAGAAARFLDSDYKAAGAEIADSRTVFQRHAQTCSSKRLLYTTFAVPAELFPQRHRAEGPAADRAPGA